MSKNDKNISDSIADSDNDIENIQQDTNNNADHEIDSIGDEKVVPMSHKPDADNLNLQAELDECKKNYLYLRADFDNYKKSAIKERSELIKYGSERVFTSLLEALDNFDRALSVELNADTLQTYREGIELTASDLKKVLEKFGVFEVNSIAVPFDPSVHEALSSEETDAVPEGHVSRVFRKAYKLHDRILRPAQVVVATAPKEKS